MRELWQLGAGELAAAIRSGEVSSRAARARVDALAPFHGVRLRPVLPANFLALPAAVVPCGTADRLPVGIQVLGDRSTDLRCLGVAAQVQAAVGAPAPIDPVTA